MKKDSITQMERIFHPRSIAVVGVSSNKGNLGRKFTDSLIDSGFGQLYTVNPNENELYGSKSYSSLKDIHDGVDLVIVATAARFVPQIIKECAESGVAGAIVFSAGFGEAGGNGKERERELVKIAHSGGVRIIGPNCAGIYCPSGKVAHAVGLPTESGSVGMISHSGYFTESFPMLAGTKGIRFSKVISCGNESDLNAADLLEYLGQDPETKLIIGYIESMKEGDRFFKIARQVSMTKPIIIWKGGLTESGAKAASSHTGAVVGSGDIWKALCKQTGVITVNSAEELLDLVLTFYYLPLPKGKRIGIVSGPGGFAVTASDASAKFGLSLAEFSSPIQQRLQKIVPPVGGSSGNPVDVSIKCILEQELFLESIKIVAQADNVDMIYTIAMPNQTLLDGLLEVSKVIKKPLAVSLFPHEAITEEYLPLLKAGIVLYTDSTRGILALSRFAEYSEFLRTNSISS